MTIRSRLIGLSAVLLLLGLTAPTAASAATCSNYSNQAAAQRAADTRDGDGDGIYCEALPCPCLKPGGGSARPTPRPSPRPRPRPRAQAIDAQITEVIDGDTIRVSARGARRRTYTVRLIGIDTPETRKPGTGVECGGKQASASMLGLSFSAPEDSDGDGLLDSERGQGRRVRLTTDPSQDTFDRYRRLLAYVETRSGNQLNVAQVAAGWAETYVFNDKPFARCRASARRSGGHVAPGAACGRVAAVTSTGPLRRRAPPSGALSVRVAWRCERCARSGGSTGATSRMRAS